MLRNWTQNERPTHQVTHVSYTLPGTGYFHLIVFSNNFVIKASTWDPAIELNEVVVYANSHQECVAAYNTMITNSMYCASVQGGGKDACQVNENVHRNTFSNLFALLIASKL